MKTTQTTIRIVSSLGAIFLTLAASAVGQVITDNEVEDSKPKISGDFIVWQSRVADTGDFADTGLADYEIMARFGGENVQITDNDGDDINCQISGNNIVWQSWDGTDWEIWAYNRTSDIVEQITNNDGDDINPMIDASTIVWQTSDGNDFEIATTALTLEASEVTLEIKPESLNLKSKGKSVEARLEFPEGNEIGESIDPSTIFLEGDIPAEDVKAKDDKIKMKFSRAALVEKLQGQSGTVELTVVADTFDQSTIIVGKATIRVIDN